MSEFSGWAVYVNFNRLLWYVIRRFHLGIVRDDWSDMVLRYS